MRLVATAVLERLPMRFRLGLLLPSSALAGHCRVVAVFDGEESALQVANVGDSGVMIVRKGQ